MTKILLAEDHEEIRDFLSRRLQRRGFDVVLANDGREALDKAGAERPDILLLDMNLPILDGWTVARRVREDEGLRLLPILALTAHAMAGDREKTIEAGCDDYHSKPIDFPQLLTQIDELLARAVTA